MSTKYYTRWQNPVIKEALKTRRVLILSGPRQCGKTTLAQELSDPSSIYRTLDNTTLMNAALSDPEDFIKHGDNLMIIDEIQRAPLLLQAIKGNVDAHPQGYGRFLLTGSSNIQSLPQVTESLAGRVRTIRLRPISMGEYFGASPTFLKNAFKEKFTPHKGEYDKSIYLSLAFTGGYPEALHLTSTEDARQWHKDYLKALIERDLKEITNIRRKDSMRKLLECLAAWSSKFMNLTLLPTSHQKFSKSLNLSLEIFSSEDKMHQRSLNKCDEPASGPLYSVPAIGCDAIQFKLGRLKLFIILLISFFADPVSVRITSFFK